MDTKLIVSASPHLRSEETTQSLMANVIVALCPCVVASAIIFGARALLVTAVSVVACVAFEWLYCKLLKKANPISDLSAVVTGIILAMNVPVGMPIGQLIIGDLVAIVIVKQLFGGIGKNFMNPALGARAFMMASWAGFMTTWTAPHAKLPLFGNVTVTDAISTATPLASLKTGTLPDVSIVESLLGQTGGVIGETSALALIVGGLYLLWRKVITINIPAAYILTVAVITFLFPMGGQSHLQWMLYQVLDGGLMLGAIFMATDYVTSPVTPKGQIVFGVGCGLLTVFIRYFGGLPEGVSYSILIMNTLVWAIDKKTHPRKFGYQLDKVKKEAQ